MTTPMGKREELLAKLPAAIESAITLIEGKISETEYQIAVRSIDKLTNASLMAENTERRKHIQALRAVGSFRHAQCTQASSEERERIADLVAESVALEILIDGGSTRYHAVQSEQDMIIAALRAPEAADAGAVATIPLQDHDEIGRMILGQPWAIQSAIVTIAAHCTVLVDKCQTGDVADLAGCISDNCMQLAKALASPAADAGIAAPPALDKCEVDGCCRKGVPGNENVVDSILMCDYCHAKLWG